jgi:hypothetical protein
MLLSDLFSYGYHKAMHALRWLPSALLLLPWLVGPTAPSIQQRVRDVAAPTSFHLLDWETVNLAERLDRLWAGLSGESSSTSQDADTLRAYFASRADRERLRPAAEAAAERQVADAYRAAGLARGQPLPVPGLFPPVLVALTAPPNVLVVAPRTALRVISSTVLQPTDVETQESIEASADSNGVSSLVAPIGGLATYPAMVLEDDSAQRVLAAIAHEWMHQYLVFYPLGAGYWNSQETREINETTAEMIGQEVGNSVVATLGLAAPSTAPPAAPATTGFDFASFMRQTRARTEALLAAGRVDRAEAYMRARRDQLARHGYSIRKLNQAYFALYGSYGEGYAASPANPIPGLLHALRDKSASLGDFVMRVRGVTTVAQLRAAATAASEAGS